MFRYPERPLLHACHRERMIGCHVLQTSLIDKTSKYVRVNDTMKGTLAMSCTA